MWIAVPSPARSTLPNAHQGEAVYGVAFSPDGQVLATVSDQGVSVALTRLGTRSAANGLLGRVHVVDGTKGREERTFANTVEAPGHASRAEVRHSLAFSEDGEWLFAPDTHDLSLRILHVASGKTYTVLRGDGPFYKAMSIAVSASMVALLRPADGQGRGPYGLVAAPDQPAPPTCAINVSRARREPVMSGMYRP